MEKPVGELLSQWKSYLTNISSNLMELSDQMEFQLIKLRAKDTANGYIGITKEKANQCVESVAALWRHFALLNEVVEKASDLYSKDSFLKDTEKDARALLETASIVIESERVAIHERSIISRENKEKKATPGELLKYMQESFADVCSTVSEITKAVETVESRLSNIKADIERLNYSARRLGLTGQPAFSVEKVAEIERNPLQGVIELDKLVYAIEKFRASIKAAEAEYNSLVGTFNKIRDMLSELRDLAARSREAVERSHKLFGGMQTVKPAIGEDIIKSLEDWLRVLESKLSQGNLSAIKIGATKLELECSTKLNIERENYYSNSRDYNEWMDLKGHFKALCAKAEALKAKGLLFNSSLNEQITAVQAALNAGIVDLEKCRQLVRKFELMLK